MHGSLCMGVSEVLRSCLFRGKWEGKWIGSKVPNPMSTCLKMLPSMISLILFETKGECFRMWRVDFDLHAYNSLIGTPFLSDGRSETFQPLLF